MKLIKAIKQIQKEMESRLQAFGHEASHYVMQLCILILVLLVNLYSYYLFGRGGLFVCLFVSKGNRKVLNGRKFSGNVANGANRQLHSGDVPDDHFGCKSQYVGN